MVLGTKDFISATLKIRTQNSNTLNVAFDVLLGTAEEQVRPHLQYLPPQSQC
jgi:hypothetical protein